MAQEKPKHVVISCLKSEVEDALDQYSVDYDLVGMCSCQVGSGFGARVEVLLAFQRFQIMDAADLPPGRQRRSPMPVLTARK